MINGNVTPALNFSKTGYLCPIFVQFLYKFNSFSASTSWLSEQNKDIPIKCWRYANKIPQTLRSTYQNWHSQQRHLENKQNLQIAPMTCSLLFRKKKGYHKIWYQPILQRPARWQRNGVDWSCQKNLSQKWKIFPRNQTYLCSTTLWHQLQPFTWGNQNRAMKTPHMQTEIVIAFVRQSTKTDKNGLTHAAKPLRL